MVAPISWPRLALPVIETAGKFQLDDRDFIVPYQGGTHSLHLYEYDATIRLGGRSFLLRPGDLTFTPAGMVSSYHVPRLGRHWCIHFQPARGIDSVHLPLHVRLPAPLRQHVAEMVLRIAGLRAAAHGDRDRTAVAGIAASALLQALLLELALAVPGPSSSAGSATHGRTAAALVRATTAIESQLSSSLDLDAVAQAAGLSRAWLAKAFQARHGVTLQRWHLQRRIDHARLLLRTTSLSVGAIAARLGFLDPQHLNKQFRRIAGCSPSAYRAWAAPNDA